MQGMLYMFSNYDFIQFLRYDGVILKHWSQELNLLNIITNT